MSKPKSAGRAPAKAAAGAVEDAQARKLANQLKREVRALRFVVGAVVGVLEAQLSVMPAEQRKRAELAIEAAKEVF